MFKNLRHKQREAELAAEREAAALLRVKNTIAKVRQELARHERALPRTTGNLLTTEADTVFRLRGRLEALQDALKIMEDD